MTSYFQAEKKHIAALLFGVGVASLALGACFYLACRPNPPLVFHLLMYAGSTQRCGAVSFLDALPSFLHALGFTCLLGACWGAGRKALLASALLWFGLNAFWEISCDSRFGLNDWRMLFVSQLFFQPGLIHECTADWRDVAAAAIGSVVPFFMLEIHSRRPDSLFHFTKTRRQS